METVSISETSASFYETTRHNIPGDIFNIISANKYNLGFIPCPEKAENIKLSN
jgi:hypothetical protein